MNRYAAPSRARWQHVAFGCVAALMLHGASAADATTPARAGAKTAANPPAMPAAKASKQREGSLGGGTASGPMLTKDELRQCIAEQDRLKQETTDVSAAQSKLKAQRADIDRMSAELDAERPKVDVSNKEAVDAFNARLQAKGRLVVDYQAAGTQFNQRVDKLDADDQAFTKNCKDRRYFEDEYDEIKAGK